MERLPPELVDMILAHIHPATRRFQIDRPKLAGFATVSRFWQRAIESRTMRSIALHNQHMEEFSNIFSNKQFPHRRQSLRNLHFTTNFPTLSRTVDEHNTNCSIFDHALRNLFHELASWQADTQTRKGLRVALSCVALSREHESRVWLSDGLFLDGCCDLPIVKCITTLTVYRTSWVPTHPRAIFNIISAIPSVTQLDLKLQSPTPEAVDLRIEHRQALATGVLNLRYYNRDLSILNISHDPHTIWDHSSQCPDFTERGVDQLSRAIRLLGESGCLERLNLVDVNLTWDLFGQQVWPSIRDVSIRAKLAMANGQWLYTGDKNVDLRRVGAEHGEYHEGAVSDMTHGSDHNLISTSGIGRPWRTRPDPTIFEPFVETMINTVTTKMPCLQRFHFHVQTWTTIDCRIVMQLAVAGLDWISDEDRRAPSKDKEDKALNRFKVWVHTSECESGLHPNEWNVPQTVLEMGRQWVGPSGVARVAMEHLKR